MQPHTIALQQSADIGFLALTIWRESRGESIETQTGIANVILNRVRNPAWWGRDLMGVVFKKWQFSSLTDPHDRQLTTWPAHGDVIWQQCLDVAFNAINGTAKNLVPGADSYYDTSIPAPNWADPDRFVAQLGRVRFYNLDRDVEKGVMK